MYNFGAMPGHSLGRNTFTISVIALVFLFFITSCIVQIPFASESRADRFYRTHYHDWSPQVTHETISFATHEITYKTDVVTTSIDEHEDELFDGVTRFVRTTSNLRPTTLFLVLTKDESSWGHDARSPNRNFYDFLELIESTGINLTDISLGIMTSSPEEYDLFRNATAQVGLGRTTILFKPEEEETDQNLFTSTPRGGRHNHAIQTQRRALVAQLRNELMSRTLHDEKHLIWIDSDIQYLSPGIVQRMLRHSETNPEAGVITTRCQEGPTSDYDKNAWAGGRQVWNSIPSSDRTVAQEEDEMEQKHVGDLIPGTQDDDLLPLDAVGGTLLYLRASLVHQGLTFPPYYVIGTRWGRDGWDGIETEGMCYAARYMKGGKCFALGGSNYVKHTTD